MNTLTLPKDIWGCTFLTILLHHYYSNLYSVHLFEESCPHYMPSNDLLY